MTGSGSTAGSVRIGFSSGSTGLLVRDTFQQIWRDNLDTFIHGHLEEHELLFASNLGSPAPFVMHTEQSETEAGLDTQ